MTAFFLALQVLCSLPEISAVLNAPNDAGSSLLIVLEGVTDTDDELAALIVQRREALSAGEWQTIMAEALPLDEPILVDGYDPDFPVAQGVFYHYRLITLTMGGDSLHSSAFTDSEAASGEWFNTGEVSTLVGSMIFLFLIFYYFAKAKRDSNLYLRPIAGIEAIDEAIGRATEMGKPILYVPGLSTIGDVATIASLTILGRVARKAAEYQTPLLVPNCDPIVYTIAEETVRQGYLEAGRPDSFDADSVFFVTDSQFAYVAGVNGIMMRDRPATNFYLGMFWAESLLLTETGSLSGAIQIAGTDAVAQLPFFITTCDYTLIGEELYAASAYLGREPKQLGSIRGQDACKAIIMAIIALGFLLSAISAVTGSESLLFLQRILSFPDV